MGFTTRKPIRRSVISLERAWRGTEKDLSDFGGTISCRSCDDTPRETLFDWEAMDFGDEERLEETGE